MDITDDTVAVLELCRGGTLVGAMFSRFGPLAAKWFQEITELPPLFVFLGKMCTFMKIKILR